MSLNPENLHPCVKKIILCEHADLSFHCTLGHCAKAVDGHHQAFNQGVKPVDHPKCQNCTCDDKPKAQLTEDMMPCHTFSTDLYTFSSDLAETKPPHYYFCRAKFRACWNARLEGGCAVERCIYDSSNQVTCEEKEKFFTDSQTIDKQEAPVPVNPIKLTFFTCDCLQDSLKFRSDIKPGTLDINQVKDCVEVDFVGHGLMSQSFALYTGQLPLNFCPACGKAVKHIEI